MDDSPVLFKSKHAWAVWLRKNHAKSGPVWLRLAKKGAAVQSVTYQEAIDVALCHGWIDAQKKPENDETWLQRFAPRSAKSVWSKINREKALRLIASGEMQAAGLRAVENAKLECRWESAYEPASTATVPADLKSALDAHPKAAAFFETLNRANRYAVLWRVQTAKKPETRARKIVELIAMLERNEKIHP
jgi:uncharacterized protein YdeI (YjbR/CyaY-like superfamily)